ncbi:hypothetical protein EYF80_030716 [Liparis tanakae]|uniref:Uncharacterized protein n=1 Tax=Liparis tanakae TaxID=230148 RepID=A0A4Z2H2I8_9TELE|nr:hypothetical protein EYF80_030716 [Liparis tanakae]
MADTFCVDSGRKRRGRRSHPLGFHVSNPPRRRSLGRIAGERRPRGGVTEEVAVEVGFDVRGRNAKAALPTVRHVACRQTRQKRRKLMAEGELRERRRLPTSCRPDAAGRLAEKLGSGANENVQRRTF